MRIASLGLLSSIALTTTGAMAAVTPGTLFGDAYLVTDGARTYSVLDVYLKCSTSKDIISSVFGTTGWGSSYGLNNGKTFVHSNGNGTNSAWLPAAGTTGWDSFVTAGNREQGSASSTLGMQLDTNWAAGNGGAITNAVGTGGAGWYPSVGSSSTSNPYCRSGFYSGTDPVNTAKTLLSGNGGIDGTITGNGIVAGQSLSNHWMIGRFTIDVTNDSPSANNTLSMQFGVAGRNYASQTSTTFTTFTGATSSAGRFSGTLTFASVPTPGAAALLSLAGLAGRRRRAA